MKEEINQVKKDRKNCENIHIVVGKHACVISCRELKLWSMK